MTNTRLLNLEKSKNILIISSIFIMIFLSLYSFTPKALASVKSDCNGSGTVDISDVFVVLKASVGNVEVTDVMIENCGRPGNRDINIADVSDVYKDIRKTSPPPVILPPQSVNATAGGTLGKDVTVTWTAVTGANSYEIYEGSTLVGTETGTTYTDTVTVDYWITLEYKVKTKIGVDTSVFSIPDSVTIIDPTAIIPAPQNVSATSRNTKLTLTWDAVADADSYDIYLPTNKGKRLVGSTITNIYITDKYKFNNCLKFYIKAKIGSNTSDFSTVSNKVCLRKLRLPWPDNVHASLSGRDITIGWDAVSGAVSYDVFEIDVDGDNPMNDTPISGNTYTYTLPSDIYSGTIRYRVRSNAEEGSEYYNSFLSWSTAIKLAISNPSANKFTNDTMWFLESQKFAQIVHVMRDGIESTIPVSKLGLQPNDNYNYTIFSDIDDNIWIGSYHKLTKFDGTDWIHYDFSGMVNSITQDIEGNIWVAQSGGIDSRRGVSKFDGTEWTTYRTDNSGIISNIIHTIYGDSKGNVWFGTVDGVSKFDGTEWITYTTADGLPDNKVMSILEDQNGNMWLGTRLGVSKFNGTEWITYTETIDRNNSVSKILEDYEGNMWFGTSSKVFKFNSNEWTEYDHFTGYTFKDMFGGDEGGIWFATNNGLYKSDGKHWTRVTGLSFTNTVLVLSAPYPGSNNPIADTHFVKIDEVGNDGNAVKVAWPKVVHVDEYKILRNKYYPSHSHRCLTVDNYRLIPMAFASTGVDNREEGWFSSILNWFSSLFENWSSLKADITQQDTLPPGGVWCNDAEYIGQTSPFQDTNLEQNVYYKYTIYSKNIDGNYKASGTDSDNFILTIPVPRPQNVIGSATDKTITITWDSVVGAGSYEIFNVTTDKILDTTVNNTYSYDTDVDYNSILEYKVKANKGNHWSEYSDVISVGVRFPDAPIVWFGTSEGVSKFDGAFWTNYSELAGKQINDIFKDNDGAVWFALMNGVVKLDSSENWEVYTTVDGLSDDRIGSIVQDGEDNIWVRTYSNQISKFDGTTWSIPAIGGVLEGKSVTNIYVDNDGEVWVATEQGASKVDGSSFTKHSGMHSYGLMGNRVQAMYKDSNNNLWFGLTNGISKFDGTDWSIYTAYRDYTIEQNHGELVDGWIYKIFQDTNGSMWFGTQNGISVLSSDDDWTSYTVENGLAQKTAMDIEEDSNGDMWVGTYKGVSMLKDGDWTTYNTGNGLINNAVRTIMIE